MNETMTTLRTKLCWLLLMTAFTVGTTACATKNTPGGSRVQSVVSGDVEDAEPYALAKAVLDYLTDPARAQGEHNLKTFKQVMTKLQPAPGNATVPISVWHTGEPYHVDYHPVTKALTKGADPKVKPVIRIRPSPQDQSIIFCSYVGKRIDLRAEKTAAGLVIKEVLGVWYVE